MAKKDKVGDFSFGFNAQAKKKGKKNGAGKSKGKKRPPGRFKNGQSWS